MTRTTYPATSQTWNWPKPNDFMQAVRVGDEITISGQQSLDSAGAVHGQGDIAAQTRRIFENMKATLERAGSSLADLVRLNTYYVFEGKDEDATPYWEAMTRVRLEFFPDPGPGATAVRVKGMPGDGLMIQIEGVAVTGASKAGRQRIMPKDSWDWSIPVPLSQGWRVGNQIFVGGQISADKQAKTVAPGDVVAQTKNIWKFIQAVVEDGGGTLADIVHVKVCFRAAGDGKSGDAFLDKIIETTSAQFAVPGPVITAFGVDLLYPGLLLEIDAMAVIDPARKTVAPPSKERWAPALYSDAVKAGTEVYVGGQTAIGPDGKALGVGNIEAQARIVFERLSVALEKTGSSAKKLKKLNLFFVDDAGGANLDDIFQRIAKVWSEVAPDAHPAMSAVRVYALAKPGLLVQADGIAEA